MCFSAALRFCGRVKGESGGRCERILQCCEREVPSGAEILHLQEKKANPAQTRSYILHLQEKKVNPAQLQKTILHCVCVAYQKWLNCYFRILEWNIKIIHKKVELLFPHRKQLLRSRTINRTLYAGIPIPILRKLRMSKNQRSLLFLTWYNIPFLSF